MIYIFANALKIVRGEAKQKQIGSEQVKQRLDKILSLCVHT
jgi:hypothetical protein